MKKLDIDKLNMKKRDLDKLKVQSFVTSLDSNKKYTLKGGGTHVFYHCFPPPSNIEENCQLTDVVRCD